MNQAENALAALNRFHNASIGQDSFEAALTDLSAVMIADCVVLELHDHRQGRPALIETSRLNPESIDAYCNHYAALSPRLRYGKRPDARPVVHDGHILSERAMDRDPFYAEFLASGNLRYFLSMNISPNKETLGILAFQFRPQHGMVSDAQVRLAEALRPHLTRTLQQYWRQRHRHDDEWLANDMRGRLGLTGAEARIAIGLLHGKALSRLAADADVSMNTVYTQYRHLKEKLHCRRQGELYGRLAALYPDRNGNTDD